MKRRAPAIICLALLAGCASPLNPQWSLVAPGTWFSSREAHAADRAHAAESKAEAKVDDKESKLVHAATVEVFKASVAAQSLPAGLAKDTTTRFIAGGLGLLQQVSPLSAGESSDGTKIAQGLLSEQVEKRLEAEKRQVATEAANLKLSEDLTKLQAELDKAKQAADSKDAALRKAFDRENALADELRIKQAWAWIASGIAILGVLAALYVKYALGGIPGALGAGLARISQKNAAAADLLKSELDAHLNRDEQARVRAAFNKHS
jgi:hypothetical protein